MTPDYTFYCFTVTSIRIFSSDVTTGKLLSVKIKINLNPLPLLNKLCTKKWVKLKLGQRFFQVKAIMNRGTIITLKLGVRAVIKES